MSLNDLNKELYKYDSNVVPERIQERNEYNPNKSLPEQPSPFDEQQNWSRPKKGLSPEQKKMILIISSVILLFIISLAGYFTYNWWKKSAFNQDRVSVYIDGPREVDSTAPTKYTIHYKNDNRIALKNVEIKLTYTENFQPSSDNVNVKYLSLGSSLINIGTIEPKNEGTVDFKGNFYAPKDFPANMHASLIFTPANSSESLSTESEISVRIAGSPISINIMAPQEIVSGNEVEYVIEYKNNDIKNISDLQIRVDFPQGFEFNDAQPNPSEKNAYWYILSLEAGQSGKIIIHGQLEGKSGDQETISVSLGHIGEDGNFSIFDKQEYKTNIISPILTINQSLYKKDSNFIYAGEKLSYVIQYVNTGSVGLRDAIITAQIKGNILDFSKIKVDRGSYSEQTGLITWKASEIPELKNISPQASGSVGFSIPVKIMIPVEKESDKNFIVSSVAKIDSPDIPVTNNANKIIGSDVLKLKLSSKVLFNVQGFYNDSKISNTGPMPIKVGSPTTFSLHWLVDNISNDISNTKIISSLPSGVRWTGKVYPEGEKISYNERTNEVIWDAGDINAATGVLKPKREVAFQVEITPQLNQFGQFITLLNESVLSATDSFTGQNINIKKEKKNTQLSEDPKVGYAGKVIK
ncbi:MAG TPA: hypothetical protein P5548_03585 [Candidatus Moranbacteria bacterium]|nr:hypothetical protein [Candidatus Moranbacteria bacterium]HRZ33951.1 hypothetical protein [Candidatus Moranbacteria bacterium]